jgi:hypothetical protein
LILVLIASAVSLARFDLAALFVAAIDSGAPSRKTTSLVPVPELRTTRF